MAYGNQTLPKCLASEKVVDWQLAPKRLATVKRHDTDFAIGFHSNAHVFWAVGIG